MKAPSESRTLWLHYAVGGLTTAGLVLDAVLQANVLPAGQWLAFALVAQALVGIVLRYRTSQPVRPDQIAALIQALAAALGRRQDGATRKPDEMLETAVRRREYLGKGSQLSDAARPLQAPPGEAAARHAGFPFERYRGLTWEDGEATRTYDPVHTPPTYKPPSDDYPPCNCGRNDPHEMGPQCIAPRVLPRRTP